MSNATSNERGHGGITRRDVLRRAAAGGALLALPGLLAACGGKSSDGGGATRVATTVDHGVGAAGTDAPIDSVTWGLGTPPPTLDIATGYVTYGTMVMTLGLEGLLTIGDDLKLQPLLAESWSQPDPLHYVYRLRSGVVFWDGTPLKAEDVAWSMQRHVDPKVGSQIGIFYANVKSVRATGEREITVTMKRPDPLFQYVPTFSFVTPKALGKRLGSKLGAPGKQVNTMGTGPYRITSFTGDTQITLERNDRYWGEKQRVAKAALKYIEDPQASQLAMRAGEIDGFFEFPPLQAKNWDRIRSAKTAYVPGLNVVYLSFDLSAAPWNDLHVRRAVAHAADRAGYVKAFLAGHGRVANAIPAPEAWAQLASPEEVKRIYAAIPDYPFDVAAAKKELARSAHPDGFEAEIKVPSNAPSVSRALVSLSEVLKPIGITLRVKEVPQNTWVAALYAHKDLGLNYMTLSPDYVDPANFPQGIYPSSAAAPNSFNTANFKDPAVDRLIEAQGKTTDKAARTKALAEVLRISGEKLPYLPLWWQDTSIAVSDKFVYEGFTPYYYNQNWLGKLKVRA